MLLPHTLPPHRPVLARRPQVPSFLVTLAELLALESAEAAKVVTAAVASQVRGILLEAAAMLKLEQSDASRCAAPHIRRVPCSAPWCTPQLAVPVLQF